MIEILGLTALNAAGVQKVSGTTGFLTEENNAHWIPEVARIAMTAPAWELTRFGLDLFQSASRLGLLVYNGFPQIKGLLAHQALRLLLVRFLGMFALRAPLDFSRATVYGTNQRPRCEENPARGGNFDHVRVGDRGGAASAAGAVPHEREADVVYEALEFVASCKKEFRPNHVAVTRMVLDHFLILPRRRHRLDARFVERIAAATAGVRFPVCVILAAGLVIDGRIWRCEAMRLKTLGSSG